MASRDRILELLEAGATVAHIAWAERCPAADVEAAIAASPAARIAAPAQAAAPDKRARSWSAAEDAIVDDMRERTLEAHEIRQVLLAQGFTRPTRAVGLRMRRLAERAQAGDAKRRPR